MELRLPRKTHCAADAQRQLQTAREGGGQPKRCGGLGLAAHHVLMGVRVEQGVRFLKITGDVVFFDHAAVVFNGALVGVRVHLRLFPAEALEKLRVDRAVLARQLGGGAAGHTTAGTSGLQHHRTHAVLLQKERRQNSHHAAADHRDLGFRVAVERRPRRRFAGLYPKRIHCPSSVCDIFPRLWKKGEIMRGRARLHPLVLRAIIQKKRNEAMHHVYGM